MAKRNRLFNEGKCVILTIMRDGIHHKSGYSSTVSYKIDGITYSYSVGSRNKLRRGEKYWGLYLPSKPNFVRLLLDENRELISYQESIIPKICECSDIPLKERFKKYGYRIK
jgi:hypothetical protein